MDRDPIIAVFKPSFELSLIDCNCSDCIFMQRDLGKFKVYEAQEKERQIIEFNISKEKEIEEAWNVIDENITGSLEEKSGYGMLRVAQKRTFQFTREGLLNYGKCSKFEKEVVFNSTDCQIHTQICFKHRREP